MTIARPVLHSACLGVTSWIREQIIIQVVPIVCWHTSYEQVLDNYPGITEDDIRACIGYGAEMSRERYVDIPVGSAT